MTFLKFRGDLRFSRSFIPILFPLLLLLSFFRRCLVLPQLHSRQSSRLPLPSSSSLPSFSSWRFNLAFPSFYFALPRCHPDGVVHRLVSRRRGEGKRSPSLSPSIGESYLLFAIGLRASFERASKADSENASFSKLKTGLSASTSGPTEPIRRAKARVCR